MELFNYPGLGIWESLVCVFFVYNSISRWEEYPSETFTEIGKKIEWEHPDRFKRIFLFTTLTMAIISAVINWWTLAIVIFSSMVTESRRKR